MMHFFKLLYPYRKTKAFVYRIKRIFLDFNSGNFKIADAISSGRNEGRKKTQQFLFQSYPVPGTKIHFFKLLSSYRKKTAFLYLKNFHYTFTVYPAPLPGVRNEGRKKHDFFSKIKKITLLPTTYRKAKLSCTDNLRIRIADNLRAETFG